MKYTIGTPILVEHFEIEHDDEGHEIGEFPLTTFGILIDVEEEDLVVRRAYNNKHSRTWISENYIYDVRI